ncbi:MAG: YciI family protein [Pseudomonadota bacterium]
MLYTLLIYAAEEKVRAQSREVLDQTVAEHEKMKTRAKEAGHFVLANRLVVSHEAKSFRAGPVEGAVLDGPFAETKEQLLGLYVLNCDHPDQAMGYARMIPMPFGGCVEVRPVGYYEGPPMIHDGNYLTEHND